MSTLEALPTRRVPADSFHVRLAIVRCEMGWNIREAARECELGEAAWRTWEIKHTTPRDLRAVVDAIASRTGFDRDWLMWGGPLAGPDQDIGDQIIIDNTGRLTAETTYAPVYELEPQAA